jgi:hypothetical protein
MSWTIGGTRIFTQKFGGTGSNIIARLQPLSGGTITQKFGYETPIRKLGFLVVGETDKNTLVGYAQSGTTRALVFNSTTIGTYQIKSFNWEQLNGIVCQTIRGDLPQNSPVYNCEMELYE